MEEKQELSREALLGNAQAFDSGNGVEAIEPAVDAKPVASEAKTDEPASPKVEVKSEDKNSDSKVEGSEKEVGKPPEEAPAKSKWAANEERRSKSWKELNAEKDTFKAERDSFNQERERHKAERSEFEKARQPKQDETRDDKGYSVKDYTDAAESFERDGDSEMAEAARRRAEKLNTSSHEAALKVAQGELHRRWTDSYNQLAAKDDSLKDEKSETYQGVVQVLQRFPMLTSNPDGLKYAYEAVKLEQKGKSIEGTLTENKKLREENDKYKKKLAIGGSAPTEQLEVDKPFEKLGRDEQRRRLMTASHEFDLQAR